MRNQPHFVGSGFQHPQPAAINAARSLLSWKVNAFEAYPPRTRPSLFFQLLTPSFPLRVIP